MDKNLVIVFQKILSGEMSSEEKSEFEDKLDRDSNFKVEFDNYRLGIIAGERVQFNELKNKVSAIIDEENIKAEEGETIKKANYRKYAYAALFILLCAVTLYFIFKPNQTPKALYASIYEPPQYSTSRAPSGDDEDREEVILNFSRSDWSATIRMINELEEDQKNEKVNQRMLAHSLLNSEQEEQAISVFKQIVQNTVSGNVLEDQWYIGLAYLKTSQLDSSLVYIAKILNGSPNSSHYKEAVDLIPEIERLRR
jgi:hypothetical protein